MIFGFVVEKNTDLPDGDPRRKFKGRVVFQGNNVKNPNWENAVFADLGSSPSSMEAGRLVDIFGLRPDYDIQQSDAVQAYLQAKIRGHRLGFYSLETSGPHRGLICESRCVGSTSHCTAIRIQARIGKAIVINLYKRWASKMLVGELGPPAIFIKNWDF